MPITQDPNLAQLPDYGGVPYDTVRTSLTNAERDNAAAIVILEDAWRANNVKERVIWAQQLDAAAALLAEETHAAQLATAAAEALEQQAVAGAAADAAKRIKSKFAPIPLNGVPDISPVIISPMVRKKLANAEWVALWHFTNAGLRELRSNPAATNYDNVNLVAGPGNTVGWESTYGVAPGMGNVISDAELSWNDFSQAAPRLVNAMIEADWPKDNVQMFATFFGALQLFSIESNEGSTHVLRHALLLYQSEQRNHWHVTHRTSSAVNLSVLNSHLVMRYIHTVEAADLERAEADRTARLVPSSLYLFLSRSLTYCSLIFSARNVFFIPK